ncbi:MAG: LysR family transcriptional regulator [Coriobacteriales bacterium]|nr:LysR family transcriptional regulator [Coriobacteriales bacterium]
MQIEYIHEFLEVARNRSFVVTAKQLNLSQSALTKHIQALEMELGTALLNRTKSRVEITSEGRLFFDYATSIWDTYCKARHVLEQSQKHSSDLDVGGIVDEGRLVLIIGKAAERLRKRGHHLTPHLNLSAPESSLFAELLEGNLDLFIASFDEEEVDADLAACIETARLPFDSRYIALMSRANSLASAEVLHFEDLASTGLIRIVGPRWERGWSRIVKAFKRHGIEPREHPVLANSTFDFVFNLELQDEVFILPPSEIENIPYLRMKDFKYIPIVDDDAFFDFRLVWRKSDSDSPLLQTFIKEMIAVAQELEDESRSYSLV